MREKSRLAAGAVLLLAVTGHGARAASPAAAGAAIEALEYARAARIDEFTPFLAHESGAVRARALLAVARVSPARAMPPVVAALGDVDPQVRRMAAFALGQTADSTAVAPLATATKDADPLVAAEAADALARAGGRNAAPTLVHLLVAHEPRVRRAAALGLGRLADSTCAPPLVAALAVETDPGAAAGIIEALEKTPRQMPAAALLPHLASASPLLRAAAARALGKTGDAPQARAPLIGALGDREWRVRTSAALALGELHARDATPPLVARLGDPTHHVREAAATALGEIGDQAAAEPLVIASADSAAGVRRAAVTAIGAVLAERGRATLATRIEDPSPYVAAAALTAFARVAGAEALPALNERTDPGQPSLVRLAAVAALAELETPEAGAPLRALAGDEDWAVAATAAEALAEIGDTGAEGELLAAATRERGFEDTPARVAAIAALGRLGSARSAPALKKALADRDPRVRAAAVECADSLLARGVPLDQKLRSSVKSESARLAGTSAPALGPVPAELAPPAPPAARRARLSTPRGTIEIELLPDEAPLAVANFARLAANGFYERGVFHRVVPNFVVQGGCPRHDGYGGPGYALRAEVSPEEYGVGTVGMADAGLDTAGSQFFLTHSPVSRLERRYTVFGRVTAGLSVLERIQLGDAFRVEILPAADAEK